MPTIHPAKGYDRKLICRMAVALTLMWQYPAIAADIRISGMGIRKCSEWLNWKDTNQGEARATALEWAQGFIAGHNIYARSGRNTAPSVVADNKILVTLLDTYCQKNPDARIFNGIVEITQNLGGTRLNIAPKSSNGGANSEVNPLQPS